LDVRKVSAESAETTEGNLVVVKIDTTTVHASEARGSARKPPGAAAAVGETENCVRNPVESLEGINKLTGIGNLLISLMASGFDVNEMDLVGLHANQKSEPLRASG
jgi:hypothetical protein